MARAGKAAGKGRGSPEPSVAEVGVGARGASFFKGGDLRPRKLYKIGEIMRHTGISRQTLHNYTMMGLINEAERTDSGHRLYPESVFETLKQIEMLKRHRTLREVKRLLGQKE